MTQQLQEKLARLSPQKLHTVEAYIDELLAADNKPRGKWKLDWAGALAGLDEGKSSVELQHEATRLMGKLDDEACS